MHLSPLCTTIQSGHGIENCKIITFPNVKQWSSSLSGVTQCCGGLHLQCIQLVYQHLNKFRSFWLYHGFNACATMVSDTIRLCRCRAHLQCIQYIIVNNRLAYWHSNVSRGFRLCRWSNACACIVSGAGGSYQCRPYIQCVQHNQPEYKHSHQFPIL